MQGKRVERVSELIRTELGNAIVNRIRDPRVGFVTITRVQVSADLHYAKVFYSVMGDEAKRAKTQEALNHARGFLQKDLAQELNLRYTPHLDFYLDDSLDHSLKINSILNELREKNPTSENEENQIA